MALVCLLTLWLCCVGCSMEAQLRSLGLLSKIFKVFEALKTLVFKSLPADDNLMLGTC